jgi:hypothetical protein
MRNRWSLLTLTASGMPIGAAADALKAARSAILRGDAGA